VLSLRLMTEADLPAVEAWLRLPHVARWWTPGTTPEAETAKYRERIRLADPDAANTASRRVLEKNGFRLVAVKPVATEATDAPMAIYRLPPAR
jgi:RimJ/RimL family protein N-acetyltransferase